MKNLTVLLIVLVVLATVSCQKEEVLEKEINAISKEKSTDLKFGFTTKTKTLIAKEHTKKAKLAPRYGHASVVFDDKMWILGGMRDGMPNNAIFYIVVMARIDTPLAGKPNSPHALVTLPWCLMEKYGW